MQIYGRAVIHDILSLGIMGTDVLETTYDSYVNFKMERGTGAAFQTMITMQFGSQL